ncbi:YrhB domain-containing protein [Pseudomonas cichorii]|uniref:YrhB domain-containing protein n=1 Tax=Pseudomonas cichorii TaxID=36746 RepID=UPI001C897BF1|nr:YrhB domain-containing protein [Pseudomonas cichorii]MBX8498224.1 YrhB family protein [Pseudomonas cichorii]
MIAYEYALQRAKEYLKDSEIPLQLTHEGEFSEGWFFCYQSKEYLETGDISTQLAGNAPFLIDKETGELYVLGTAKPLKEYLDHYVMIKSKK